MPTLLLRQAQIITMNPEMEIFTGDILITDDTISAIDKDLSHLEADQTIDAREKIIIPGFVQTHIHLCQTLFRGQADDLELLDWLKNRIWPLEAAHDEESIYYSALLGIGELIRGGTTTILDMETVHHTNSAFLALAQSGIRALSGKVMMDQGESVPQLLLEKTADSLQESVDLLEKWHNHENGRLRYAFCPRFVVSCTEELLIGVRDLSQQYQTMVHTHAAENKGEIALVEAERGMRNIVYLDHIGLANENLILAHCIWLDEKEKEIIRKRKVKVAHCPGSNLKLASGIAHTPDLLQRGIHVGLGADGAPCNNNLNMFHEMRFAALIQKPFNGPTAMPAKDVFYMATLGGAKCLGLENEIGSLEPGKKADLVILNLNTFHTSPSYGVDPISQIVYSATPENVETVIINGKIVMENRRLLTIDENIVLQEGEKSIQRLLKRLPDIV